MSEEKGCAIVGAKYLIFSRSCLFAYQRVAFCQRALVPESVENPSNCIGDVKQKARAGVVR
jgi:hypothetical protein